MGSNKKMVNKRYYQIVRYVYSKLLVTVQKYVGGG
jgi:hypothetical protein